MINHLPQTICATLPTVKDDLNSPRAKLKKKWQSVLVRNTKTKAISNAYTLRRLYKNTQKSIYLCIFMLRFGKVVSYVFLLASNKLKTYIRNNKTDVILCLTCNLNATHCQQTEFGIIVKIVQNQFAIIDKVNKKIRQKQIYAYRDKCRRRCPSLSSH